MAINIIYYENSKMGLLICLVNIDSIISIGKVLIIWIF